MHQSLICSFSHHDTEWTLILILENLLHILIHSFLKICGIFPFLSACTIPWFICITYLKLKYIYIYKYHNYLFSQYFTDKLPKTVTTKILDFFLFQNSLYSVPFHKPNREIVSDVPVSCWSTIRCLHIIYCCYRKRNIFYQFPLFT